jgi:hypothetical protein
MSDELSEIEKQGEEKEEQDRRMLIDATTGD